MDKLLIIDGSNLLFQMFFGMPSRIINQNGKAIHGTLGFVGALIKIIKMTTPTHIIVIFDGENENKRKDLFSDYKSNRIDYSQIADEYNPYSQIEDIYSALTYMNIKHIETSEFEADDVIASYTHKHEKNMKIIISSFDSDFFQLINKNVNILRYRGEKTVICNSDYISQKYGILPCQYADFKALTGDKADNIKGAEHIGIKTASALINQFGNLDCIIKNAEYIKKPSIKSSILQNSDRLKLNHKLIKLNDEAAASFDIDELKYTYDGIITTQVLKEIGLK